MSIVQRGVYGSDYRVYVCVWTCVCVCVEGETRGGLEAGPADGSKPNWAGPLFVFTLSLFVCLSVALSLSLSKYICVVCECV